jgi:hypothetical protein
MWFIRHATVRGIRAPLLLPPGADPSLWCFKLRDLEIANEEMQRNQRLKKKRSLHSALRRRVDQLADIVFAGRTVTSNISDNLGGPV